MVPVIEARQLTDPPGPHLAGKLGQFIVDTVASVKSRERQNRSSVSAKPGRG
tara:strand:- start:162 stop:317 length:156 start_codon:yes stop_codon:yes gene_type:complete